MLLNTTRAATLTFAAIVLAIPSSSFAQEPPVLPVTSVSGLPSRIAFGSCSKQTKPQPILDTIVAARPELFIYLGDNIYGDTKDMNVLRAKYKQLGDKPEFRRLRSSVPVLSTWDDHDFGWNDAGKEYPFKAESKQIFMDFWNVPKESPRRSRPGIYGAHEFSDAKSNKRLQVLLLDTRTFRDPLRRRDRSQAATRASKNDYLPDADPNKTLLGDAQWKWLEQQLRRPADARIICSSIQFGHEYNGWESWTNLPREQTRMLELIRKTKANGVVFVSGDVHWAELSRRRPDQLYPIYDLTASGLTEDWHNVEPNRHRVGQPFRANHFGMLEFDWQRDNPTLRFRIVDVNGKTQIQHEVALDALRSSAAGVR